MCHEVVSRVCVYFYVNMGVYVPMILYTSLCIVEKINSENLNNF